ncbi:hypothetical protein [Kitasatospora sp. NPDC050543]|uniref:hypothetical protein n=1 Tax=Kitasatospora sp. NPDC050543 TaxID=3364054 RepID=UPI00379D9469
MSSYDAVRAELPRLRALLGDPDLAIRTRTAYLLGWYPEEAGECLPQLDDERDPVAVATALVAAGLLAEDADADQVLPTSTPGTRSSGGPPPPPWPACYCCAPAPCPTAR